MRFGMLRATLRAPPWATLIALCLHDLGMHRLSLWFLKKTVRVQFRRT